MADDTTVMSSVIGSTSTLETSRRTTPASGLQSTAQSRMESTPPSIRIESATQSGVFSSSTQLPQQQRHLLKWSLPSSRGSFTNLEKVGTIVGSILRYCLPNYFFKSRKTHFGFVMREQREHLRTAHRTLEANFLYCFHPWGEQIVSTK